MSPFLKLECQSIYTYICDRDVRRPTQWERESWSKMSVLSTNYINQRKEMEDKTGCYRDYQSGHLDGNDNYSLP